MHSQNSAIVVVIYLLLAVVGALGARLACLPTSTSSLTLPTLGDDTWELPTRAGRPSPPTGVSTHAISRANDRLAELERTLEETLGRLEQRTALLHEKDAECRRLKTELDESIDFMFSLMVEDSEADRGDDLRDNLRRQLDSLQSELSRVATDRQEQVTRLDELRGALLNSEMRIDELRLAAEAEFIAVETERAAFAAVVREAVASLGGDIVPVLTELIKDRQPAVRAWAASAIGQIGIEAASAAPALLDLLADSDPQVRETARQALFAVDP
jgi:hypothetical protein